MSRWTNVATSSLLYGLCLLEMFWFFFSRSRRDLILNVVGRCLGVEAQAFDTKSNNASFLQSAFKFQATKTLWFGF